MLEYSILSATIEDILAVQTLTTSIQPPPTSYNQRMPSYLQYLGLPINLPQPPRDDTMIGDDTTHVGDDTRIRHGTRTCNYTSNESVNELTKDLDETMGALQDKINELMRLDDELQEHGAHTKHATEVSPPCHSEGTKRVRRNTDTSSASDCTMISDTDNNSTGGSDCCQGDRYTRRDTDSNSTGGSDCCKGDRYTRRDTDSNSTGGSDCCKGDRYTRRGSCDLDGTIEWETDRSSRLDSLLETSFRITERIRQKAHSVSFAARSAKTHGKTRNSMTCSKIDFALKKRTKQPFIRIPSETTQSYRERRTRTIANKTQSLVESKSFVKDVSRLTDTETLGRNDGDLSNALHSRMDSPISCCFKESENTLMPDFQGHPLEELFKDRRETITKTKSKRSRNVFRLLDCKKSISTTDDDIPEQEQHNQALSAFINRRRSINIDDQQTQAMCSSYMVPNVHAKDRMKADVEHQDLELCSTQSSKHRLLRSLRIKKGLISFSNLKSSFVNST